MKQPAQQEVQENILEVQENILEWEDQYDLSLFSPSMGRRDSKSRQSRRAMGGRRKKQAMQKLTAAMESVKRARDEKYRASLAVVESENDFREAFQDEVEGTALYCYGDRVYIGEEAFRMHTEDALHNEKVPESGAVVRVDGETFTLFGRFNVAQLLYASAEVAKGEIHNKQSLACNEEVLRWDEPVADGNEYTKVDAPAFPTFYCNEYIMKDGTPSASKPCYDCTNPLCKRFSKDSMLGKNEYHEYRPTSPVYSPTDL